MDSNYVVYVDIPALQNFVDYLREHDACQIKLAAAAERLKTLTQRFAASSEKLKEAATSKQP